MSSLAQRPASPIVLLGQSQQQQMIGHLSRVVLEWQRQWSVHLPAPRVQVCRAPQAAAARIRGAGTVFHGTCDAQSVLRARIPVELAAHLVGVSSASSIGADAPAASALFDTLARSFCTHLIQACSATAQAIHVMSADAQAPAAHWLRALIEWDGCEVTLDLNPLLVEKWFKRGIAPANQALVRRRVAIGEASVRVEALLGTAEVTLADLAALATDDVIVFEQELQSASELRTLEGTRVGAIHLGRSGTQRAISLTSQSNR